MHCIQMNKKIPSSLNDYIAQKTDSLSVSPEVKPAVFLPQMCSHDLEAGVVIERGLEFTIQSFADKVGVVVLNESTTFIQEQVRVDDHKRYHHAFSNKDWVPFAVLHLPPRKQGINVLGGRAFRTLLETPKSFGYLKLTLLSVSSLLDKCWPPGLASGPALVSL